jgi:hypothetical protein
MGGRSTSGRLALHAIVPPLSPSGPVSLYVRVSALPSRPPHPSSSNAGRILPA